MLKQVILRIIPRMIKVIQNMLHKSYMTLLYNIIVILAVLFFSEEMGYVLFQTRQGLKEAFILVVRMYLI